VLKRAPAATRSSYGSTPRVTDRTSRSR
jgi:hypothetical protein